MSGWGLSLRCNLLFGGKGMGGLEASCKLCLPLSFFFGLEKGWEGRKG